MKPAPLQYFDPETVDEVFARLAEGVTRPLPAALPPLTADASLLS